jgi:hypothetical protein
MKRFRFLAGWVILSLLFGCNSSTGSDLATPLPDELLPTVIAQTLEASGIDLPTATARPDPTRNPTAASLSRITGTAVPTRPGAATGVSSPTPTSTQTFIPSSTPSPTSPPTFTPTATLAQTLPPLPVSSSTPVDVPEARVQINRLGELSWVISPVEVSAQLTSQVGKVVRIELYGEDGRLLARQVRTYNTIPWRVARIGEDLDFEISGAGEQGRLVISVEDVYGRLIDVNSVNLILLSTGATELNPMSTLWQAIVILEPSPLAMIQGGVLIVSGLAKPSTNNPLRVVLVTREGKVVGQRLAAVTDIAPGGYGTFVAEVSYSVTELTPVLLVVYEEGEPISDIAHLSSVEILLSP